MKKNIVFIGMPAVGKSTVGIVVAKRLGMRFIDTDLLIQEQEGKLLREIITEKGVLYPPFEESIKKAFGN